MKVIGRTKYPLECWGCTNSPRYYADRFHAYRNFPNKMEPEVAECVKQSIQEYAQQNWAMVQNSIPHGIRNGRGQTSSNTTLFIFAEHRAQLDQFCNEEGFSSLYHALIMCEMVEPYTSRSSWMACAADFKTKYYRENLKMVYEG